MSFLFLSKQKIAKTAQHSGCKSSTQDIADGRATPAATRKAFVAIIIIVIFATVIVVTRRNVAGIVSCSIGVLASVGTLLTMIQYFLGPLDQLVFIRIILIA